MRLRNEAFKSLALAQNCTIWYLPQIKCDQIWRNFATLAKKSLVRLWTIYLLFGSISILLWQIFYTFRYILIVVNGHILNKQSGHTVQITHPYFSLNLSTLVVKMFLALVPEFLKPLFKIVEKFNSKLTSPFQLFLSRTAMEDSSHSTPSPMSSAASSQDSLHRGIHNPYQHLMVGTSSLSPSAAHAAAAAKKKGVKSTLGRIFGKKDKQMKAMKDTTYVTMPMTNSPSGGFAPQMHQMSQHQSSASSIYGECDIPTSDSMNAGLGGLAAKGDFDRRKKKR